MGFCDFPVVIDLTQATLLGTHSVFVTGQTMETASSDESCSEPRFGERPRRLLTSDRTGDVSADAVDGSASSNDESQQLDYLHLVTFLGIRNIQIIPFQDLHILSGLSRGVTASMQVSLGEWNGQVVAVKAVRPRINDLARWFHDLHFELQIMSHEPLCSHPNIVRLLGISFEDVPIQQTFLPVLVVEAACAEYPDLTRFLCHKGSSLRPATAKGLIADIADGLTVLHQHGVIHGDLKPDNILIFRKAHCADEGICAKLCDFGFSGSKLSDDATRGGSIDWCAPECLHDDVDVRRRAANSNLQDIYSFGLLSMAILMGGDWRRRDHAEMSLDITERLATRSLQAGENSEWNWLPKFLPVLENSLAPEPSQRQLNLSHVRNILFNDDLEATATMMPAPVAFQPFRRDLSRPVDLPIS